MIGFDSWYILFFLIIIPVLFLFYKNFKEKKKKHAIKFSHLGFIKSALGNKSHSKKADRLFYLMLISIALMIIGFSNPTFPLNQSKEGVNIVVVIDTSGSMQATDYTPNRIEAAKSSAEILLKSLKPKDYVGIVTFQNGATTAAYLTPDKEKAIEKLRNIKVQDGQTAIGDGLALGIDMATSIPNKKKVVVLLSDGVNNAGVISPDEAISFAKTNDIQVNVIGMGSEGQVILGTDWFGRPQYAELDEATLQKIASSTGGQYFKSVDEDTLNEIYKNISDNIKREKEKANIKDFFFLLALLVLLVELYLRYGRKRIIQ